MKKTKKRYYVFFILLVLLGVTTNYLLPLGLVKLPDFGESEKISQVGEALVEKSFEAIDERYPFKPVMRYNQFYLKRIEAPQTPFPEELFLSETLIKDLKDNLLIRPYQVESMHFEIFETKVKADYAKLKLNKTFVLKDLSASGATFILSVNEAYLLEKVGEAWKLSSVVNDKSPYYWDRFMSESSDPSLPWMIDRYDEAKVRYGNLDFDAELEGLLINPNTSLEPVQERKKLELKLGAIRLKLGD